MRRPSSPRERILCSALLMVVVFTLLGHACGGLPVPVAAVPTSHDSHNGGIPHAADSEQSALHVATLSAHSRADLQLCQVSETVLATLPVAVAMTTIASSRTASVPPGRSADGSLPLFLLHAALLI